MILKDKKMKSVVHDLKILPAFYEAVESGRKTFEIRKNDREYEVGMLYVLMEYDPVDGYTGRLILKEITFITDYEQKTGYIVFSIGDISVPE